MYGMVNKAIEDLICTNHGDDAWEEIKREAGVDVEVFVGNEGYGDEITYRLVGAASKVLNLPAEQILEAFGEWWILKTAREGYGELMDAGGANLADFLVNLPNFHTRVTMIYPALIPPKFQVTDRTANSLVLHYFTHRPGLVPFVKGLILGLGKMFETPTKVIILKTRDDGAEHDEFFVEW